MHEIAHQGTMDHGEGHNADMSNVTSYLVDNGLYDYYRDSLLEVLVNHESAFTAMRDEYEKSTTRNTAKSLKDYGTDSSARTDDRDRNERTGKLQALSRREGRRGDGNIPPVNQVGQGGDIGGRSQSSGGARVTKPGRFLDRVYIDSPHGSVRG